MKPEPTTSPIKAHTGVTRYDPEFALLICERIATTALSLVQICQAPDMPGIATIFRWLRAHPEFRDMYTIAKETQAEVLIEEALEIVDDDSHDILDIVDGKPVFNRIHLQRCKMQVEHRRWIAAKLLPRKYGTYQREKPATTSPAPHGDPAPTPVLTEAYRVELIALHREAMEQQPTATLPTPNPPKAPTALPSSRPDLRSPNSDLRPSGADLRSSISDLRFPSFSPRSPHYSATIRTPRTKNEEPRPIPCKNTLI